MRVLFGTSSWGLGHATRDLVLMRALLEADCRLTIVASGNALAVLKGELGQQVKYLEWPDMPTSVAKTSLGFYGKTIANIPRILTTWFSERRRLRRLLQAEPFDLVISDHRYGMVVPEVPCYFITHSPRYIAPWRSRFMEAVMEGFMAYWLRHTVRILVPDDELGGLSGEMSHALRFHAPEKPAFLGILSSIGSQPCRPDLDLFITISGPEPQRTRLEETVLSQLHTLTGRRIVVTLGRPEAGDLPKAPPGIEVHGYLDRTAQAEMMNRAKLVVCRSGYTTLMELAELGKPALLIPTPGQSEQLYLAKTLRERGLFYSVSQRSLCLERDVERAIQYPGYRPTHPTAASIDRFVEIVLGPEPLKARRAH